MKQGDLKGRPCFSLNLLPNVIPFVYLLHTVIGIENDPEAFAVSEARETDIDRFRHEIGGTWNRGDTLRCDFSPSDVDNGNLERP